MQAAIRRIHRDKERARDDGPCEGEEDAASMDDESSEVEAESVMIHADTTATVGAVDAALSLTGEATLSPEVLAKIIQSHVRVASDIREQQTDAAAAAAQEAEHAAASSARDLRFKKRQEESEDQRDADEMNGNRSRKPRSRSRTPPGADGTTSAAHPLTGSPTEVPVAVLVKTKSSKKKEKKKAKAGGGK